MPRQSFADALRGALSGLLALGRRDPVALLLAEIDRTETQTLRIFREGLGCPEQDLRRMEICYFAIATATLLFEWLSSDAEPNEVTDQVVGAVLEDSVAAFEPGLTEDGAMRGYRARAAAYGELLSALLESAAPTGKGAALPLLRHLYACVTGADPDGGMDDIAPAAALVEELIREQAARIGKRI